MRGAQATKTLRACAEAAAQAGLAARLASGGQASPSGGGHFVTLAQLQAASKQAMKTAKDVKIAIRAELADIPPLVRSIWGRQSELVVAGLAQSRAAAAARLIRQWEAAEHRLVATANALASSQSGQKLVLVGVPLAAAQLLQLESSPAQCYSASVALPSPPASALLALVDRALCALRDELHLALRALYLFALFLPAALSAPACLLGGAPREAWLQLMRWTLERAGPAFIKWGQWAATRPDLFAPDVCAALAALQTDAPRHSYAHTRRAVEAAFGAPLHTLFASFEPAPVASGSIAQVHHATLTAAGSRAAAGGGRRFGPGATVAVKVRHPGVSSLMERDFELMRRAAAVLAALPLVGTPQVQESLMQFGAPLREQLDLAAEARHLARFGKNFARWRGVCFPAPAGPGLVSSDVLVESFEDGQHISKYVDAPGGQYNKRLAGLGLHCYLKMLLRDNFIHADLHPGNILVSLEPPPADSLLGRAARALSVPLVLPRLVLLDVGMTAALSEADQANLVTFFKSLTAMDGAGVADSVMAFSRGAPPAADAFRADMAKLFDGLDVETMRTRTADVMASMMDTIRDHQVHLAGVVSTVVITTMVLEGWSTKLDPEIRILEQLRELLPAAWPERASRGVDRVMAREHLALAA